MLIKIMINFVKFLIRYRRKYPLYVSERFGKKNFFFEELKRIQPTQYDFRPFKKTFI